MEVLPGSLKIIGAIERQRQKETERETERKTERETDR